jgi:flagellar hook-associated protein 2
MAVRLSGLASNMDTESIVAELMSAQRIKRTKIDNKKTKMEWSQEKWKTLNSKLYSFYKNTLSNMRMQSSYLTKSVTSSDDSKVKATATSASAEGTHTLKITSLASAQFVTGAQLGSTVTGKTKLTDLGLTAGTANKITITNNGSTKSFEIKADSTINDLVASMKDAGINASFDTSQRRLFLSSKDSGVKNAFTIGTEGTVNLNALGLATGSKTVAAADAAFEYNGMAMTSSTNNVSVNGITLNLVGTTGSNTVTLNIANDTKAVYDMIKNFVKGYNEVLTSMNESYYANLAKGYEPLTDDQKEAMTDDQIEKWETKIKDSLLRRDSTLGTLIDSVRNTMGRSVAVDNKAQYLSTFGIVTTDYTERGLLHINGDKDDSSVADMDNDLMTALTNDPDKVMKVFTKLASDLYDDLGDKMKSTTMRSALTFYNDKEMKKQIDDYEDTLKTMDDKLQDMEARYYKQFTAMEKAMSQMNSKSNYLTSMLGGK